MIEIAEYYQLCATDGSLLCRIETMQCYRLNGDALIITTNHVILSVMQIVDNVLKADPGENDPDWIKPSSPRLTNLQLGERFVEYFRHLFGLISARLIEPGGTNLSRYNQAVPSPKPHDKNQLGID